MLTLKKVHSCWDEQQKSSFLLGQQQKSSFFVQLTLKKVNSCWDQTTKKFIHKEVHSCWDDKRSSFLFRKKFILFRLTLKKLILVGTTTKKLTLTKKFFHVRNFANILLYFVDTNQSASTSPIFCCILLTQIKALHFNVSVCALHYILEHLLLIRQHHITLSSAFIVVTYPNHQRY